MRKNLKENLARRASRKLMFVTEWIEKRRGSQGVSPDHVQGHSLGFPRNAIQSQGGEDVKGDFSSSVCNLAAVSKHSHDSTSKVYPNQLDLTWDDFALLSDILDTGKPEVEKRDGDTVISYTKDYGDICFKVIQRIGRKRRHGTSRLMFVTEWIEKTTGRKGLAPVKARDQVPSSPGKAIQSQGEEDVNSIDRISKKR